MKWALKPYDAHHYPRGGWYWRDEDTLLAYHWGGKVQPSMLEDDQWGYFKTEAEALEYGEKHGLTEAASQ